MAKESLGVDGFDEFGENSVNSICFYCPLHSRSDYTQSLIWLLLLCALQMFLNVYYYYRLVSFMS